MYLEFYRQMKKQLGQVDAWLVAGEAFARDNGFDPAELLALRLAPDQFPLVRQVQIACDTAKLSSSRLTGKEAPSHADTEATIDELRARIRSVISWLDGISEQDLADAATRTISQPRWEGKVMTGHDYFIEHAVPNFFFHLTHTYALLRHRGVGLGKRDYLGAVSLREPNTAA